MGGARVVVWRTAPKERSIGPTPSPRGLPFREGEATVARYDDAIVKRPPTFRMLVLLLLLLGGGAIVNVAVAWHSVVRIPLQQRNLTNDVEAAKAFLNGRGVPFPSGEVSHVTMASGHCFGLELRMLAMSMTPTSNVLAYTFSAGWPCRSVCATTLGMGNDVVDVFKSSRTDGIRLTGLDFDNENLVRVLPLRPLLPGFAINTIFYAAILWLIFIVPFALRRQRRINRGLCPQCAYDLRGRSPQSNTCPECGGG